MNRTKSTRRSKIRVALYIAAVIIVLATWAITQTARASRYKNKIILEQQRTISSLASYLSTVETDLKKMQYVNTVTLTSSLALSMSKAATGAKNCLAELSAGSTQLYNINKFLSQAGDYVQSVDKRLSDGGEMTSDDREAIAALYEYCADLNSQVSYLEQVMFDGDVRFEEAVGTLSDMARDNADTLSYLDAMSDAEDSFSDYPTLIYDGPFSDNIAEKQSKMLENEEEITADQAKELAAKYCSVEKSKLTENGEDNSKLASYVFTSSGVSVAVTKKGGYLRYMLSDGFVTEEKIKCEDAVKIAAEYLEKIGCDSMKETYYFDEDGICTVNFAYLDNGVVCYPDLIKVGVSMGDGSIVSVDATTYIMNHIERDDYSFAVSESAARENISDELTVKSVQTAVIPTDDGKEKLTYEFLCEDKSGGDALVYIDAATGNEAQLLLLLYSDGGTLTR